MCWKQYAKGRPAIQPEDTAGEHLPEPLRANVPLVDGMLRRLKLKPLLIFDRVLASHSIARAAKELNLTQPAVTKAIQELEDDLGVELFERTNRGVVPTCYATLLV